MMDSEQEVEPLDWSFQGRVGAVLHGVKHPASNFKRCILEEADLTESNFAGSNFSRAAMRGANLMKSNFDNCDFRGADLRKAKMNMADFRNCQLAGADLRGIRGRYAIWQGSDWWNAKVDDDLAKVLEKKWGRPEDE
jgi:uncharacterized protein YjbI with pentapeptide repeats